MNTISVQSKKRTHFIDITNDISSFVDAKGIKNGIVTAFVPHTTAGITVNENADPDVVADLDDIFDSLVPWSNNYRHFEGNTAAHAKASMMGSSVQIIVENSRLCLGTWQSVYFCEFDGPRMRKIYLKGISE